MRSAKITVAVSLLLSVILLFSSCSGSTASTSSVGCEHSFGEWTVTAEPTCVSNGSRYRVCAKCSFKETDLTPVDSHVIEVIPGRAATCESPGLTDGEYCTACHQTITEQTATEPLGHSGKKTFLREASLYDGEVARVDCDRCGYEGVVESDPLPASSVGLPYINIEDINGTLTNMTKYNEVTVSVTYSSSDQSFTSYATMKWQGNSSLAYDKKNYTIKLYEDSAATDKNNVDLGWGKENKYCLKANYVDCSQSRNIVSARLFADIVACRNNIASGLAAAPNYGVIDGFPILLYINGDFDGLYTLNIPKDNWLFGMKNDETKRQAILVGDDWSSSAQLKTELNTKLSGWDLEHCSTEDTAWVRTSFNDLIRFINNNDGDAFRKGIGNYLDVEAAIDTLIFTYVSNAYDNVAKNCMYVTYDGTHWIPSMYDMDSTWGLYWDGSRFYNAGALLPTVSSDGSIKHRSGTNVLFQKLLVCFPDEIKDRYAELRKTVLSEENINAEFIAFKNSVPEMAYYSEKRRWPNIPSSDVDHYTYISAFVSQHLRLTDRFIDSL